MILSCKKFLFSLSILALPLFSERSNEEAFTYIYQNKMWGMRNGEGTSGEGSMLETTETYRQFLQSFFSTHNIRSVVDVGCGDWEFSRAMNWEGIEYVGYDVVPSVIEKNQAKFTTDAIHFVHGDATAIDLPSADLLICKDVLQHLPNQDIQTFIKQLGKFKYCLITNDVYPQTMTSPNYPIERGGFRPVDLTKPPFFLKGMKVMTFVSGQSLKQTLLICHE